MVVFKKASFYCCLSVNAFPNWAASVAEDEPKLQRLDVPELGDTREGPRPLQEEGEKERNSVKGDWDRVAIRM